MLAFKKAQFGIVYEIYNAMFCLIFMTLINTAAGQKKVSLIEIEASMVIFTILIMGATSRRDDAMYGYQPSFFHGWKPLPRAMAPF